MLRTSRLRIVVASTATNLALRSLTRWQKHNPHVADYRVTIALHGLREAALHLAHLRAGTQTAEFRSAMKQFRARFPKPRTSTETQ